MKSLKQDNIQHLSATLTRTRVADLVHSQEFSPEELFELTFHPDLTIGFRAAWILEYTAAHAAENFEEILEAFLSAFPKQKNLSAQRHFSNIILRLLEKKAPEGYKIRMEALSEAQKEELVAALFDWLILPKTPVAVKANCLDALAYFCGDFDWIQEELEQQIDQHHHSGSPALIARGKMVQRRLYRYRKD